MRAPHAHDVAHRDDPLETAAVQHDEVPESPVGHRAGGVQSGVYQGLLFERNPNLRPSRLPPRGTPCCKGALETNRGRSRLYERPVNGVYRAGSDVRQDGHAGGW